MIPQGSKFQFDAGDSPRVGLTILRVRATYLAIQNFQLVRQWVV